MPRQPLIQSQVKHQEATIVQDDGTYYYICKASAGSATSASVWQIKRVLKVSPFTMTFPGGDNNYKFIQTSYAGFTYS